jgi:hypothetical protein
MRVSIVYRLLCSFFFFFQTFFYNFLRMRVKAFFFPGPSKRRGGGTAFFSLLFLCLDLILSLFQGSTRLFGQQGHTSTSSLSLSLSSVAGSRLSIFTWGGAKGYWGGARREGGR